MSLREIELQQSLDRRDMFITALEKDIELLKQALLAAGIDVIKNENTK